jgi:hypothetical protein
VSFVSVVVKNLLFLLALLLIPASCQASSRATADWSAHYQAHHDYESLTALIPSLDLHSMTRSQVEELFGPPVYCPTTSVCYYPSDRSVNAQCGEGSQLRGDTCIVTATGQELPPLRFTLILVVIYDLQTAVGSPSDPLSGFSLAPVGE